MYASTGDPDVASDAVAEAYGRLSAAARQSVDLGGAGADSLAMTASMRIIQSFVFIGQ